MALSAAQVGGQGTGLNRRQVAGCLGVAEVPYRSIAADAGGVRQVRLPNPLRTRVGKVARCLTPIVFRFACRHGSALGCPFSWKYLPCRFAGPPPWQSPHPLANAIPRFTARAYLRWLRRSLQGGPFHKTLVPCEKDRHTTIRPWARGRGYHGLIDPGPGSAIDGTWTKTNITRLCLGAWRSPRKPAQPGVQ